MTSPGGAEPPAAKARMSRRGLLRGGALLGAGAAVGAGAGGLAVHAAAGTTANAREAFYGTHQAGILTNTQQHVVLASFDVLGSDRRDLIRLLQAWSELAAQLVTGESHTVPIFAGSSAPPSAYASTTGVSTTDDSLEAYGLNAARLSITVGFGRSLFIDPSGNDRLGLKDRLPPALIELPRFPGDQLVDADSGGDLLVQACADNPQVAFHAVRSIARISPDVASLRWTQLGYSPGDEAGTPRNLMGFKDGTLNSAAHPPTDLDATLWAGDEGPGWMVGGSYLVYRRIRIALQHWDRLEPALQEKVIGRQKLTGAPLGGSHEFEALNLDARDDHGKYVIAQNAHVRLAAPAANNGAVMVRRAFSYNNGTTQFIERWPPWRQALEYDAGLLFLAYQKDPRTAFVPVNTTLARSDAMNQFTTHTASAVFAVPRAATGPGDWIGGLLLS